MAGLVVRSRSSFLRRRPGTRRRSALPALALPATGLLLVAAALVPAGTADAATRNLAPNPSVEISAGSRPSSWSPVASGTSNRSLRYLNNGAASGHRFVRTLVYSWRSGTAGWTFAPVRVSAGTTYTYSVRTRSNASALVQARVVSTTGAVTYLTLGRIAPSTPWRLTTFTFRTPARATRVSVQHLLTGVGTLDVDDVRLVAGAPASSAPTTASTPPTTTPTTPTTTPTTPPAPAPTPTPQPRSGAGLVSVTFDDGLTTQYDNARPVLAADGIPATFYLVSSLLYGGTNMTVAQARTLQSQGHEIGSHTVTHRDLTTLSAAEVTAELADSKAYLESQFGPVHTLAYPYGATNAAVEALAARYYSSARTTDGGLNVAGSLDPLHLRMCYVTNTTDAATVAGWLRGASSSGDWVILVYHGIDTSGSTYTVTPAMFAAHMGAVLASGLTPLTVSAALARVG